MEYRPSEIEPKWRRWWQENQVYKVETRADKPKYYILDMFPYPSGAGLHVGHPLGYIASDIMARYKRLCGFNVLHPMGYDSFGLPAEQYAIQTGTHPAVTTEQNINRYREQLENIGFSFDWSRELRTSDPGYYKWTQWIFMQLFNHYYDLEADKALPISSLVARFEKSGNVGVKAACDDDTPVISPGDWNQMTERERQLFLLKYRLTYPGEAFVNWCPALGSVLSNDEVKEGVSERGGHPVERKLMNQWNMRITAYANRLLSGLDTIDWPESIKDQQRNWIGKSVGAAVKFALAEGTNSPEGTTIEVFTTRIDTIYGATFMVLAPEHELVNVIKSEEQAAEVDGYVRWAAARSEIERMAETKKVTGKFTGAYAINPFNQERIPIWIADYVLAGYGTGAVMAVPSGDQRDWQFAKHFDLPIVPISDAQKDLDQAADPTKEGRYINSRLINGMSYEEAVPALIKWLELHNVGKGKTQYKLRNAVFSRQRYWGEPVPAYWKDGVPYLIDEKELPLVLPKIDKYLPTESGEPPLGRAENWKYKGSEYELSTMPGWAGSSWYFYRYMDPNNSNTFCSKEALGYWQDVDFYIGGSEHAVGHLLYSRFWNQFMFDIGLVPHAEFAKKLVNQGMIGGRSNFVFRAKERFFEQFLQKAILIPFFKEFGPNVISSGNYEEDYTYDFTFDKSDLVIEVTSIERQEKIERIKENSAKEGKRLLVLFTETLADHINEPNKIADLIARAMESLEELIVPVDKPVSRQLFVSHDLICDYIADSFTALHVDVNIVEADVLKLENARELPMFEKANFKLNNDGKFTCSHELEKMSKSKFNVVNPDDMVAEHGADCFRMFEMFLGPITDAKPWNTQGISGVSGFLKKFWGLFFDKNGNLAVSKDEPNADELRALHQCIKKVTEDLERMGMNTCVSHFMIATNELRKLNCSKQSVLEPLVIMLAPFGPHIAEELWHILGHENSVCDASWPSHNEEYLKSDTKEYPIQVNGKLRGTVELPSDVTAADAEAAALGLDQIQKWLEGKAPKKVIFVPGRMINIVV
ncbi:MAG: leucine--tRNA ligase [Lewinellaceae bacterium]|nr:leucine--tRNA ligase [Saprospiraceae bacterium]MCB9343945.1 leucine--tRNA ligase [Lewinellaceae bacterium]